MTRHNAPRLPRPRHSHRHSPGQLSFWNRPILTVLLPTGRSLQVLDGGRVAPVSPEPVVLRKVA